MRGYWLFLMTSLFVGVCSQEKALLVFSRDEKSLSECIRNHLMNRNDSHYEEAKTKDVADYLARRFKQTITVRSYKFVKKVSTIISETEKQIIYLLEDNEEDQPLLVDIIDALENCADDESDAPEFDEPRELASVLDFILVDWLTPIQKLISTRNGLILLRRYAREARMRLEDALNFIENRESFRNRIRNLWLRRARRYFDFRSEQLPYILHTYTMERGLRTYGTDHLSSRSERNFLFRNPPLRISFLTYFLHLHDADRPPYVDQDIFARYSTWNRMTNADLFIETRIDRFYRTLLFVQEVESTAGVGSEVEIYPVPRDVSRRGITGILYNDKDYREILLNERACLSRDLERYSTRSRMEMGLLLSSAQVFQDYWNSLGVGYERRNAVSCPHINDYSYLPEFYFESEQVRVLLDFILVDWDTPLYYMIQLQDGRELLRQYATEAQAAMECFLRNSMNRLLFRHIIRGSWMLRAQYYFDGRLNDSLQYIPHRYNMDRRLYTTVSLQEFYSRVTEDFDARNPRVEDVGLINNFLQSHPTNFRSRDEDDIFHRYQINGMSSAEYYFEIRLDQFYRIIFFFNELSLRGITNDGTHSTVFPFGTISTSVVVDLRQILYNNRAYSTYLTGLQMYLRPVIRNNKFELMHSEAGGCIHEESLIFYLSLLNIDDAPTNATNTGEIFSFPTTTSKYGEPEKRRRINSNQKESSCKRSRAALVEEKQQLQYQYNNDNNYYGFITYGPKLGS